MKKNRYIKNINIFFFFNKRSYYNSIYNKCFWKTFSNIITNKIILTEKMQFLQVNKNTNIFFRERNRAIFHSYLNAEKINKFQQKCLLANDKKSYIALEHPGFFFKYKDQYYFIPQTSHLEGFFRKNVTIDQIKSGKNIIFQDAELIRFIEILNKYYTPIYYHLGGDEHIKFYDFNGLNTMSNEQINEFENFIYNNNSILSSNIISLKNYVKPDETLKILEEFNIINKEEI